MRLKEILAINDDIKIPTPIVWSPLKEKEGGGMRAEGRDGMWVRGGHAQKELLEGSGVELKAGQEQH